MQTNDTSRLIQNGWRGWLRLFGVWSIPLAVAGSAYWMQSNYEEQQPPFSWFLVQNWIWYLWAALCPWAYHLVVRYPSGRRFWLRGLPLHLFTGLASSMLVAAVYGVFRAIQYGGQTWWEGAWANMTRASAFGNTVQTTVIYGLVAGAMYAIYASRLRKQREAQTAALQLRTAQLESQLVQSQLHSLHNQLQPHFLFNALNSLASLVEQRRNDEAFHMIGLLGELLRATLERDPGETVTLRDELDLARRYLAIEQVRFPDRLHCEQIVDESCWDAAVPPLILQPLIENCIQHAVNREATAGRIRIEAAREEHTLCLRVVDDGPGLPPQWSIERHRGVGLDNVAERLQVQYGEAQALQVHNGAPRGVVVELRFPLTLHPAAAAATSSAVTTTTHDPSA